MQYGVFINSFVVHKNENPYAVYSIYEIIGTTFECIPWKA